MNEKQDVIELSKEYSIVTQFTSFVAIEKRDKVAFRNGYSCIYLFIC